MRFKGRKWASPFFIISLAVAGIFGVTAGVVNKQVEETPVAEKADASDNSSKYSTKMYFKMFNDYNFDKSSGVFLHLWGDGVTTIDVQGVTYDGTGGVSGRTWCFMVPDNYVGKNSQVWVSWKNVGSDDWSINTDTVPDNDNSYRWIEGTYDYYYGQARFRTSRYSVTVNRITTVDYSATTTVEATGDFTGITNEYNKSDVVLTVTNPNNDGKVATLGQWSTSSCTGNPHTNHVLTNNQKTFTKGTYQFTSHQYFKPVLYNTLQYSLNGGSTWVDLDCNNPTASTRVYSASSVSMTADSQIKFRFNGSEVNPTLSYGSNFYTSGGKRYVKETGTGDISITYSSSTYSGTFGALATKTSGYYVLNYTTGDLYSTTSKGDSKYGTAITYLYNSEVIRFMHSDGSNNSYYSIKEVNSYSTSGVYSLSGGDVTIIGSDYYYLEIQPTGTGNDKLYIESYGVTITYNLNGHGDSFTDRVERNQTFSAPSDPSSTGYTFAGWYKEAGCTNAWNFASDTTSTDKTLYAKWNKNTNNISYTLNGGTHGTNHPTSSSYDTVFNVSAPTRSGYTFTGWTVTSGLNSSTAKWGTTNNPATAISSSSTKCVNGTNDVYFKNINPTTNTSVTFTANWSGKDYTISFDNGGGSGGSISITGYTTSETSTTVTVTAPTKQGYTNPTYSIERAAGSGGDAPTVNNNVITIPANSYGNFTINTIWSATTYNITYALNGGSHGSTHPSSGTYDTVFYVSAPTKTGYTFTGWTVTSGLNSSTAKWGTTNSPATQIASSSTLCVNGASGNVYFKNINAAGTAVQFTANWTPNTDTPYTVNHYQQNLDGSYPSTPTDTDNLTGTTGEEVTPDVNTYTGFIRPSAETVTIAADGSTVVNYQYTRAGFMLQLHMYNGVDTIYYKFEGAAEYSSTTRDTNVWPLYGQTVYLYATARDGYIMDNDYTEDDPLVIVMDENGYNWTPTATSGEDAAITFATNFNTRVGGICVYAGGTNFDTLKAEWNGTQQTAYNNLADYQKYWLDKNHASSDDNVQDMFAMYDYIADKYGTGTGDANLHDFLNRNSGAQASAISNISPFEKLMKDEDNLTITIIIIASSVSLLSITALCVLISKKKKQTK